MSNWRIGLTAVALASTLIVGTVFAQQRAISIATGGTGGVYYPLGGGLANVLSKALPGIQATAEVT
ncbi:MAG: TAXI family TRAP transporter solute-binding subunit, partial [Pseudolabrys sp.]